MSKVQLCLFVCLLIVSLANCHHSDDGIRHKEIESAFVPWFNDAILKGKQSVQRIDGVTFESEASQFETPLNISFQDVRFTVGPISRVRDYVENVYNGINVRLERPDPLIIWYNATAVNLDTLAQYEVSGQLRRGQRVSFRLHRARRNDASLDMTDVVFEQYSKKRTGSTPIIASDANVQKLLENSRTLFTALESAAASYFVQLWNDNDHSSLVEALRELYKFNGVDIFNYY
ncbi:hypothetical protein HDE_04195 [Halotydeus destructor]|nr:hypothetical protein HDE_04195 [Halotydeus destructor]